MTLVRMSLFLLVATAAVAILSPSLAAAGPDAISVPAPAATTVPADQPDKVGEQVRQLIEKSGRYLHHSKLTRGMKGYGLTVLSGTEISRFNVEIISVMSRWEPRRDVILVRLSGANLENSGLIAGMSGSPVFVTDPADGKDKLIGAVAFGFSAIKEPICGLQPIAQMLEIELGKTEGTSSSPRASSSGGDSQAIMSAVLDWQKVDYLKVILPPGEDRGTNSADGPQLTYLATPLMVGGLSKTATDSLGRYLVSRGFIPVQAGSSGAAFDQRPAPPLAPGAALAISLLTGDADLSAVGTVTEVIGDRILAFGHPFFDEGDVEFPMSKAYVHTVIPSILQSFKLTSASDLAGSLVRDESTGVIGMLGKSASMIPQTITVDWKSSGRSRQFNYMLARHRTITPLLAAIAVLESSSSSWHDLPDLHTIRYDVQVDCEGLGSYRAANISSGAGYSFVISDLLRPLAAIMNNPFTVPPNIKDLKVNVSIESRQRTASILKLELDGRIYRPGETVTGKLTYRPFRAEKTTMDVQFKLPDDLKDGNYTITACDSEAATRHMISEMPQRFNPRNLQELFQAIQRLVENKADNVYLRMQLPRQGVALESRELTDLPASRTRILMEQDRHDRDINQFTPAIVTSTPGEYVFAGSAQAEFTVQRNPKETLIRE